MRAMNTFQVLKMNPDLSTLVTAIEAADLVDTLSGVGPFTVFAPTNQAFAALPPHVLEDLLKPSNKAQLLEVLTYHVVAGMETRADRRANFVDGTTIKTADEDATVKIRVQGSVIFVNTANITSRDNNASNGVVQIIDEVLTPPPATNHLWFRGFTCRQNGRFAKACQCGEVDAAARMPASLFDPSNKAALERYISITEEFYKYQYAPTLSKLEVGRCRDTGVYTSGGQGGISGISWTNKALIGPICKEQCPNGGGDDPANGKFCSLCGPKYNSPISIKLYQNPNGQCRPQDLALC